MSYLQQILNYKQKQLNGLVKTRSEAELSTQIGQKITYQPVDVMKCLTTNSTNIIAEFKRASPSEGTINNKVRCEDQIVKYLVGVVAGISVLTEDGWFDGSCSDLIAARKTLNLWNRHNRHVFLLRKDFIFSTYQILESAWYQVDSILLIVAAIKIIYPDDTLDKLTSLISFTKQNRMTPIIEVTNKEELDLALSAGASVVGINTRDLNTFKVDHSIVRQLVIQIPESIKVILFSGVKSLSDMTPHATYGLNSFLIGTSLMKSNNPTRYLSYLSKKSPLVKICGITDVQTAEQLRKLPVDLIGLFFTKSKRQVNLEMAEKIINIIRRDRLPIKHNNFKRDTRKILTKKEYFSYLLESAVRDTRCPLIVGVFKDDTVNVVNSVSENLDLDLIQLHGNESPDKHYSKPVIKAYSITDSDLSDPCEAQLFLDDPFAYTLFDSVAHGVSGGTGIPFNHKLVDGYSERMPYILAGGLNPDNISEIVSNTRPWMVDVSSGVEKDGKKDINLIKQFIRNAKLA